MFYSPPLFHASFAWWFPDKGIDEIELGSAIDESMVRDLDAFVVKEVCCKIGNLEFEFALSYLCFVTSTSSTDFR
jgi:hypothetical protein